MNACCTASSRASCNHNPTTPPPITQNTMNHKNIVTKWTTITTKPQHQHNATYRSSPLAVFSFLAGLVALSCLSGWSPFSLGQGWDFLFSVLSMLTIHWTELILVFLCVVSSIFLFLLYIEHFYYRFLFRVPKVSIWSKYRGLVCWNQGTLSSFPFLYCIY